jgi:hypothetical protein
MKRQQEGTVEGLKAAVAYAGQHQEMYGMQVLKMLIDYCISIGDAKAESMSQEELVIGLTNFIASKKNESTKGKSMNTLTEKELNLLETLMIKEARATKAGKKLALKDRVQLAVLKRNLKRQFENDGATGMEGPTGAGNKPGTPQTVPNEEMSDVGFADDIEAAIMPESKAARIKAIKEKIAQLRNLKEEDLADHEMGETPEEETMEDDEDMEDEEGKGLAEPATVGDLVDALQGAADQLAGAAVEDKMEDEDLDQVLESVRQKVLSRREKLANLRKSMNEDDSTPMADLQVDDQGPYVGWLNVAGLIGEDDDTISKTEAAKSDRSKKVEAIKAKIAKSKREAEVMAWKVKGAQNGSGAIWGKEGGDGHKVKHNQEGMPGADSLGDSSLAAKPAGYPDNSKLSKKGLTEKLDFENLLKKGILG